MRVDMVERVAMLVRTAARQDILKLLKICCHWRGQEQMGQMLLVLIVWLLARRQAKIRKSQRKSLNANARHNHRKITVLEDKLAERCKGKTRSGQSQNDQNRNLKSASKLRLNHKRSNESSLTPIRLCYSGREN